MTPHATEAGTAAYAARFSNLAPGHFRAALGAHLSSIGLGTYLGDPDRTTDAAYAAALRRALQRGCNVIDTAINYRFQRSERSIGEALADACAAGETRRDEVFIATKGGYLSFDATPPRNPSQWYYDTYVATGVATVDDLVAGCHCMTPAYLKHQIATSLKNLRIETIDLYYVHNPEAQLGEVSRDEFQARLQAAFGALEEAVSVGQIRYYGVATWNGFRQSQSARDYLSLADIVRLAEAAGGPRHHFRAIQLPHNLAMPEAFARGNQRVGEEMLSTLAAAERLGITVIASASMLQGQLSRKLPADLATVVSGLDTDAQRAIQFVRSTPGLTTALAGMKSVAHVDENLAVATRPPLSLEAFHDLFRQA